MSRSYKSVRAVLFDFGGTLDSDGVNWKDRFFPYYLKAGLNFKYQDYEKCFYKADDYLTEQPLKNLSLEKTLERQVSLVLRAANRHSMRLGNKITNLFLRDSLSMLKRNQIFLRKLKKQYRLGIVSNFYGNLPSICREIGYAEIFDVIVDSVRVGAVKPDPKIFYTALDSLKCGPEQAIFVGDSLSRDMMGAKGIGMAHIWLKANGLKAVRGLKPCCPHDPVIHSLTQLEKILIE